MKKIGKIIGFLLRIVVGWAVPILIFLILNFILQITYIFNKYLSFIILTASSLPFLYYYYIKRYQIQFYLFVVIFLILCFLNLLDIILGNNVFIYILILFNVLFTLILLVPGIVYEDYRRVIKLILIFEVIYQIIILYSLKTFLPIYHLILVLLLVAFSLMNLIPVLRPFEERNLRRKVAFLSLFIALIILFSPSLNNIIFKNILQENVVYKIAYITFLSKIDKEYTVEKMKNQIISELYSNLKDAHKERYKNFIEKNLPNIPLNNQEQKALGIK